MCVTTIDRQTEEQGCFVTLVLDLRRSTDRKLTTQIRPQASTLITLYSGCCGLNNVDQPNLDVPMEGVGQSRAAHQCLAWR